MKERVLIASGNPWSFCMAVERDFARTFGDAQVDALNLFGLSGRASPHWRRRDKLIETINRKYERFVTPAINGLDITSDVNIDRHNIPPLPASYDELRAYEIDGVRLGLAVLSSVTSLTTIQQPSSLSEFGLVLGPCWRSAHLAYRAGKAVQQLGYDTVVLFNGRHCYSRPFSDLLQRHCEVIRYEQGSTGDRYIAASASVHEPETLERLIVSHDFDPSAGDAFFRDRLEKAVTNEVGFFTAHQRAGMLPESMTRGSTVAFFTSSADEMLSITDEPLYGKFASQSDVALALAHLCHARGLQLLVRLHPHLRFKNPVWRREWDFAELKRRGAIILEPDDAADSYAIVQAAHSVVTTGSTIGIEASYLEVPNAVVGPWVGGRLGISSVANNREDLAHFLAEPRLAPNARQRALLFGSFYKSAGRPLPELDVGLRPNLARIAGRIVDPVRYAFEKLRSPFADPPSDGTALDLKSGMQAGRVVLASGSDYGKAARSGSTKLSLAATEKSRSGE